MYSAKFNPVSMIIVLFILFLNAAQTQESLSLNCQVLQGC